MEAASEGVSRSLEVEKRRARRRSARPQGVQESGEERAQQKSERTESLFIVVRAEIEIEKCGPTSVASRLAGSRLHPGAIQLAGSPLQSAQPN